MKTKRIVELEKKSAERGRCGIPPHFLEDCHTSALTKFSTL